MYGPVLALFGVGAASAALASRRVRQSGLVEPEPVDEEREEQLAGQVVELASLSVAPMDLDWREGIDYRAINAWTQIQQANWNRPVDKRQALTAYRRNETGAQASYRCGLQGKAATRAASGWRCVDVSVMERQRAQAEVAVDADEDEQVGAIARWVQDRPVDAARTVGTLLAAVATTVLSGGFGWPSLIVPLGVLSASIASYARNGE